MRRLRTARGTWPEWTVSAGESDWFSVKDVIEHEPPSTRSTHMKEYLLTAGPTPVPERVLLAMARPVLYHRAPAFTECLKEVQEGLRWLLQTKQLPLLLAGSGT